MTVKELRDILDQTPDDQEVFVWAPYCGYPTHCRVTSAQSERFYTNGVLEEPVVDSFIIEVA